MVNDKGKVVGLTSYSLLGDDGTADQGYIRSVEDIRLRGDELAHQPAFLPSHVELDLDDEVAGLARSSSWHDVACLADKSGKSGRRLT